MIEFGLPKFESLALSATRKARLRERVLGGLTSTAQSIAEDIRQAAPEDEGALRDSVHVETDAQALRVTIEAGGQSTTKFSKNGRAYDHAMAVEYGTTHQPARPFFYPPINAREDEFGDAVDRSGQDALDEG